MPYQKASSIEEVAATAIMEAMDDGAESDEDIVENIERSMSENGAVGGAMMETVVELYWSEFQKGDEGYGNIEYTWPTYSGTLYVSLMLNVGNYIAEVAKRILQEEQQRPSQEPNLEDYPLRTSSARRRRHAYDEDVVWVVSTRAPDGEHIIGEAPTQDEALRLLERHMGYEPGHLTMGDIPELVDDIGAVYSIEEEWKTSSEGKTESSMFDFWGWDTIIETGKIEDAVKDKLAGRERVTYLKYDHPVSRDFSGSKIEQQLWKVIDQVVDSPYSAKGGKIYQEDLEAVAQLIEDFHPEYGPMYAAELRALK